MEQTTNCKPRVTGSTGVNGHQNRPFGCAYYELDVYGSALVYKHSFPQTAPGSSYSLADTI
jgi:hypothetical protein